MKGFKFKNRFTFTIILYTIVSMTTPLTALTVEEYIQEYLYCYEDSCPSNAMLDDFYENNLDTAIVINVDAYHKAVEASDNKSVYWFGKRILTRLLLEKGDLLALENFAKFHLTFMKGTSYEPGAYLHLSYCYDIFNLPEQDITCIQEAYRLAKINKDTSQSLKALSYLAGAYFDLKDTTSVINVFTEALSEYEPTSNYSQYALMHFWDIYRIKLNLMAGTSNYKDELMKFKNKPYFYRLDNYAYTEIKIINLQHSTLLGENNLSTSIDELFMEIQRLNTPWYTKFYLKGWLYDIILKSPIHFFSKKKWDLLLPNMLEDVKKSQYDSKIKYFELLILKYEELNNKDLAFQLSKELNQIQSEANQKKSSMLVTTRVDLFDKLENLKNKLEVTELKNNRLNKTVSWAMFCIFLLVFICVVLFKFYRYYLNVELKLKGLNHSLELKNQNIDDKNQILEQFSFTIAHDFAEPIRSIKNTLSFIDKGILSKAETEEMIESSFKSIDFLNTLIGDFLIYSKSCYLNSSRKLQPLTNAVELAEINLREYSFDLAILTALPQMHHSQSDMVSVFQNLIKNSIKYCPSNRKPVIEIEVSNTENWYQIRLKDNGLGIPEDKLVSIFSPFSRLQPKGTVKGSGLGLSIIQNIIDKYDGFIVASNNKDVGATFTISLPTHLFEQDENTIFKKKNKMISRLIASK